jgi:hypothetical protein
MSQMPQLWPPLQQLECQACHSAYLAVGHRTVADTYYALDFAKMPVVGRVGWERFVRRAGGWRDLLVK